MDDVSLDENQQNILTCNQKNYLNSIISGDLNETFTYSSDSSEEETELYINNLIKRLTLLDRQIWHSIEVIQNNVCGNLIELSDILRSLPDRDSEFKRLVNPLNRVEDLALSIERKFDKTHKLRQLKNLKTLLTSNQRVLSLIYNWDDNIRTIQTLITSYLKHKDSFNMSNKDSTDLLKGDHKGVKYFILDSSGFTIDDLDKLKTILLQLKGDSDTCLKIMSTTNIPQTMTLIMEKYYIILEDLTVDIVHLILVSYNFYDFVNSEREKKYGYHEEHYNGNVTDQVIDEVDDIGGSKEINIDMILESMKVRQSTENKVKELLERFVKFYVFEKDLNTNMNLLNRHLKNKIEDLLLNYFRKLCTTLGFDLFTRNKGDLNITNNLETVEKILHSLLNYIFLLFITFKDSFQYMHSVLVSSGKDDSDYLNSLNYKYEKFDKEVDPEKIKSEELFRKLVLNTLSSCILNSNLFYVITTLRDEDLYRCLNYVFNTFDEIFTKYNQYLEYLNVGSQLEYMTFIPFDVLDKYVLMVYNQAKLYDMYQYQRTYKELVDCTSGFKYMVNQLNRLYNSLENDSNTNTAHNNNTNNKDNTTTNTSSRVTERSKEERGVLNWLYIYCVLNMAKVEFDSMCEEADKFISGYFGSLVPNVETNPINTSFELNCRNVLFDLIETYKSLSNVVLSLLTLTNKYLNPENNNTNNKDNNTTNTSSSNCKDGNNTNNNKNISKSNSNNNNKIYRNVYNCLKEQHDWNLSNQLLEPFKEVIFKNKSNNEVTKEFDMSSLFYSLSQHLSRHISNNVSYLFSLYYQQITSRSLVYENDNVNMYIEIIGEYYINLLSIYYENIETFTILKKSMEMFIDSEFETLANLKTKTSELGYKKNVEYLIKITKLVNVSTSDSLSMLIN